MGKPSSEEPLITQKRACSERKPNECSECSKTFSKKPTHVVHQRTHTGEKPCACSKCGKVLCTKQDLIAHQITRRGEKHGVFNKCAGTFVVKSDRKEHERTHTEENLFECDEHGCAISKNSPLVEHQKAMWKRPTHVLHVGEPAARSSPCGISVNSHWGENIWT